MLFSSAGSNRLIVELVVDSIYNRSFVFVLCVLADAVIFEQGGSMVHSTWTTLCDGNSSWYASCFPIEECVERRRRPVCFVVF